MIFTAAELVRLHSASFSFSHISTVNPAPATWLTDITSVFFNQKKNRKLISFITECLKNIFNYSP